MISYAPLWETMKAKGVTTYTLRYKQNAYGENIGGGTFSRIQAGESISTNTLNILCKILECRVEDIIEYIPD